MHFITFLGKMKRYYKYESLCLTNEDGLTFSCTTVNVWKQWKWSACASLTNETFTACIQSIEAMSSLSELLDFEDELIRIVDSSGLSVLTEYCFTVCGQAVKFYTLILSEDLISFYFSTKSTFKLYLCYQYHKGCWKLQIARNVDGAEL